MPSDQAGLLYIEDGRPVQPDPTGLAGYRTVAARRGGHWPSSPDIGGAMLEP